MKTDMRVVAPIQVRMGSSRLPGKSLMELAGKPMLEVLIERVSGASLLDELAIATSQDAQDDPIADLGLRLGLRVFRGSEEDVLHRLVGAAELLEGDVVVDLTGDNPFVDSDLIDQAVKGFFDSGCDYLHTSIQGTYPLGYVCQVYPLAHLREALIHSEPGSPHREHPNYYLYSDPERFKHSTLDCPPHLNRPNIRLTVDYLEDLEMARAIFDGVAHGETDISLSQIIDYLDRNPDVLKLNRDMEQKRVGE